MLSQEFQVMEGHMDDYWTIPNSAVNVCTYIPEGDMNTVQALTIAASACVAQTMRVLMGSERNWN